MRADNLIKELKADWFPIDADPHSTEVDGWILDNIEGQVVLWDNRYWFENDKDRLHWVLRWIGPQGA